MQSQQEIHSSANIQLSHLLSNTTPMNEIIYSTYRYQNLKKNNRLKDNLSQSQVYSQNTSRQHYQNNIKQQAQKNKKLHDSINNILQKKRDQMKRSMTSNNPSGSFRKTQKRKIINAKNGFKLNQKPENILQNSLQRKVQNTYREVQKKNNKGPLEAKFMENWLNDILMQYSYQQKFDTTLKNPALKKYQIDRNSLLSKGINHQKISRIYRAIFVYSIGFNNLLDELTQCTHSLTIKKTIWKVYAILLQYCAKGDYQTMVGEIERDKQKKIQNMKQQLQKRQKIIDQCQQLDKQRNIKMIKQVKKLKDLNFQLFNQNKMVQQDFKQADQALNQQVSLRLKFQHKINQIHGIYRQLSNKHKSLYEDFNAYRLQHGHILDQRLKQELKNEQFSYKLIKIKEQNQSLRVELKERNKLIQKYENKLDILTKRTKEFELRQNEDFSNEKSNERNLNFLKYEVENANGVIRLKQNALNDQSQQVDLLLQENKKLLQKLDEQKDKIDQYTNIHYRSQLTTVNIKTNYQVLYGKYRAKLQQLKKLKQDNQLLVEKSIKQQTQLNSTYQKIRFINNDITNYRQNIQQMIKQKLKVQGQLNKNKTQNTLLKQIINDKDNLIMQLNKKISDFIFQQARLRRQLQDTKVMMKFHEDSFNHDKNIIQKKYQKVKIQRDQLAVSQKENRQLIKELQAQNEKVKRQDQQLRMKLKNQIYQKNSIQLKYKQTLLVMQQQSKYMKQLSVNFSYLKQQKQSLQREYQILQQNSNKKIQQTKKQINKINQNLQQTALKLYDKNAWIHPLYYWDLQGKICSLNQKYISQTTQMDTLKRKSYIIQKRLGNQISDLKQQFQQRRVKYLTEFSKKFNQMQKNYNIIEEENKKTKLQNEQMSNTIIKYEKFFESGDNPKQVGLLSQIKQRQQEVQKLKEQKSMLQKQNKLMKINLSCSNEQIGILNIEMQKSKKLMIQIQVQIQKLRNIKIDKQKLEQQLKDMQKIYKQAVQQLKQSKQQIKILNQIRQKSQLLLKSSVNKQQKKKSVYVSSQQNIKQQLINYRPQMSEQDLLLENQLKKAKIQQARLDKLNLDKILIKQDNKRKQIVRKMKGAFNYYNKIAR